MTRAPRVLVSGVVLGQPMGGVRRHNAELLPRLARELAAQGGSLSVLEGREPVAFELPAPIARLASDVPARPALLRAASESSALKHALERARGAGAPFDLVHVAHLPAPRGLDVPFTITLHDLRALDPRSSTRWRRAVAERVVRDAVERAAGVLTVSATVAHDLATRFALAPGHTTVVGNAADHFVPLPRAAAPDARIACIGHLERRKNLEVVVRALALDPALPDVDLFGAAKGDEAERLLRIANELGATSRVHVRGPFDESALPRILAECACVALPSLVEGFGIVALEAHRARAPLAIAAASALPEIAARGTPRFAPHDASACALALRAALGATARELDLAEERARSFTWDACTRRWLDAWLRVASRGG